MRLRTKILLTVSLAVLASFLFGCGPRPKQALTTDSRVTDQYLRDLYVDENNAYFQGKLPEATINTSEDDDTDMATTTCSPQGEHCIIRFNPKYVTARRVAEYVMLHEQCHVKTWNRDKKKFGGVEYPVDHGRLWRACMLQLDQADAFRDIFIDEFTEEAK